ncbi:hypothetical protein GCM10011371_09930 [Novosphingobium marinum]|uniref:Catechol 2,3-dioxygenase-like lactoylglutathione lyase family enzyme n=1 Tax=Novosphingobium marinum TaxID=1514948 RepID=A0A7Y9XV08_9SPHN|nr:VOC family protein [Novosphingobium marinum]NYH95099.1 catechol 2,3-dioxygenase-like lactoylglutathione lyase family enzyme [Novosphingobium marinum]GGC24271.1 hypothetical protein GCM10011371_09930 [Novosphingobium marinum]
MQVQRLDHVNIRTGDLEGTVRFYAEVLGLERRNPPEPLSPEEIQWMADESGQPIFHLVDANCENRTGGQTNPGGVTGAIDHVALNCAGYEEIVARLQASGADFRTNDLSGIGLRQVFTRDPNNVLIELNFYGE